MIDEAGANLRLQPEETRGERVTVEMVENIVAKMARIPAKSVSASDRDALRTLERDLKLTIFGQDAAIESLSAAIKMARSGLREEEKADRVISVRRADGCRQDRGYPPARACAWASS